MEIENNCLLVGIGCNISHAPPIPLSGPNAGRESTCLMDHLDLRNTTIQRDISESVKLRDIIVKEIYRKVLMWLDDNSDAEAAAQQTLEEFEANMDYSLQHLRPEAISSEDGNSQELSGGSMLLGESITPLSIALDGSLKVCFYLFFFAHDVNCRC